MKLIYPAIIHSEADGTWVEFPDFEGCQSFGDGISDTIENAREALEGYCIVLLEEGKKLPEPTDIRTLKAVGSDFITLIDADITPHFATQKSVKKTLTIPAWLNKCAESAHMNFSAVLQDALIKHLNLF